MVTKKQKQEYIKIRNKMNKLFTYFSNMRPKYICALAMILCVGVGNVWAVQSSEVANSASTSISDGDLFIIATAKSDGNYLTTTVSSSWGICTTTLSDAALFTAHVDKSGNFYLTCSAGTLVPAASKTFNAYNDGTSSNLSLNSTTGAIQNSSSTSWTLRYNTDQGKARWYDSSTGNAMYLFKVTITPKTLTYDAGAGSCKDDDTEASGGAGIVLPSATPSSLCADDGWVFAGWKRTSAQTATTNIPTLYKAGSRYYPDANETLYAVYRKGYYVEIDFESATSAYTDWTFTDIRLNAATPAITAHGGSQYGRNVNASGNGVSTASITSNSKIASPGKFRCYISKESTNTTSSTWSVETSGTGSSWDSRGSKSAIGMDKGVWQEFEVDLSSYSDVYVRISYGSNNAIRAIDDIILSSATFNSNPDCTYDWFIDIMHDTEIDPVQGSYSMPAALSDASKGDEHCDDKHYHFLGWVEDTYVKEDGTLDTEAVGFEIIPAGDSGHTANNKTYYAIWGKEE
jgi:hypothetical protein